MFGSASITPLRSIVMKMVARAITATVHHLRFRSVINVSTNLLLVGNARVEFALSLSR